MKAASLPIGAATPVPSTSGEASRETFLAFLDELIRELQSNPGHWSNNQLDTYLEALSGWIADMDGYYQNRNEAVPEQMNWRTLREALLAARNYE